MPAVSLPVWRYCQLIEPYRGEGKITHHPLSREFVAASSKSPRRRARRRRLVRARPSPRKSSEAASLRAITTRSHPRATSEWRATSRSLRLIRLRTTAFPTFFPTVYPKRLVPSPLGRATKTSALFRPAPAFAPHLREVLRPFQAPVSGHRGSQHRLAARGSHRKSLASLEHAAPENIAAAASAHSRSEAVHTASDVVCVVGTFVLAQTRPCRTIILTCQIHCQLNSPA